MRPLTIHLGALICLLVLSSRQGYTQKIGFGVALGYNLSKPTNTQVWADLFNAKLGWEKSIRPTVFLYFPIGFHIAFQSEIALVDQGRRLELKSFHAGDSILQGTIMREKVNFIKFNQLISFEILLNEKHNISLFCEGGPYYANFVSFSLWGTDDKICTKDGKINLRKDDDPYSKISYTDHERRSQFGISAGLGFKKQIAPGSFIFNFRYEQALTNNYKSFRTFDLSLFRLHRVMAFSVGYIFNGAKLRNR
jgi:hypothetical protein